MHGFKSFANRVEIPFDNTINVVIGANGSGKSNISDGLCFVLGRLSIKSMRAERASHLLFQGTKDRKPAQQANVDIVFDNSDRGFGTDEKEVIISRIVRKNGLSIYRINNQTKTRQEVLEFLARAGIDPNGFNIVLQGEISRFVKMHSEERREIIEEIAGISIYESRKQKALHEIEKTEQKLKEVNAVLRERTAYLRNLEEERKQALKFKELEKTIKNCKATILKRGIEEKEKQLELLNKDTEKNRKFREKVRIEIEESNSEIASVESKINQINQYIQKTTGLERETLSDEITELNVKIASDSTKKENFEKRLSENETRKTELENNIEDTEKELEHLKKESPAVSKRQEQLRHKKKELEEAKEQKEHFYSMQTEFNSIQDRIKDRERTFESYKSESKVIFNQISSLSNDLKFHTSSECEVRNEYLKKALSEKEDKIKHLHNEKINFEKSISIEEFEIEKSRKLVSNIPNSEICPLCKSLLTPEHRKHVGGEAESRITFSEKKIFELRRKSEEITDFLSAVESDVASIKKELSECITEIFKLKTIEEKKGHMKRLIENEKILEKEIEVLKERRDKLEKRSFERDSIEDRYEKIFFEMQELSSRTDENLDIEILHKEREIESITNLIRGIEKDRIELQKEIVRLSSSLKENTFILSKKQKELVALDEKFKKMYSERTELQEKTRQMNILIVNKQNIINRFDEAINNLKIEIARFSAEVESLEFELKEFGEISFIQGGIQVVKERLERSEKEIFAIGNVNLRALETYDAIKSEYEKIASKAEQLKNEQEEIMKVIQEIDTKKKKTFMRTFDSINELFTKNFSELSTKGKAFLEIENKDDIFSGGVTIAIKVAKGKYFDVTSLSGGEQTLVALSLIFSIQEFKPYCFYIFDEIDAALDKRNSELLATLFRKYMKRGQYIVISHNDSIISGANIIYGVSMNQGVSKVITLKLSEGNGNGVVVEEVKN